MVAHTSNPNTQKAEAEASGVQGQPNQYIEFEVSWIPLSKNLLGLEGKVFAVQTRGPQSEPLHPTKRPFSKDCDSSTGAGAALYALWQNKQGCSLGGDILPHTQAGLRPPTSVFREFLKETW